jgi:D-alanyl-D-alanine carboxypeptidase/uncharacterized membrane protein
MKNWKALIAGFLVLCLMPIMPYTIAFSEENEEAAEYEEEDPIPDSYYLPIESNETTGWPQGPEIEAASATVMDMDTGVFMYSKNATAKMYPASTTKIMTTLLLVENCDLDDEITFSDIVYDLEEGSSHLGMQPGETITLRDAAYGIMLASANDISNGVAEYIGGSISGFADMMNAKAEELGCVNTHFANPHGLYQEDHYTCAYDMALIARAAYANPVFREIVTTREYTIPATNMTDEERSFLNHQKMMQPDEEYYQEWCTGGKTGYTEACLNTLVTFAEKDGKSLVSVVFRVNGAGKAYTESTQILEYALDHFQNTQYSSTKLPESFYDSMGLRYFGEASNYQSAVWKRSIGSNVQIALTLPDTASLEDLSYQVTEGTAGGSILSYSYNGYPVGTATGSFGTVFAPVQMIFEREIEIPETVSVSSDGSVQEESLNNVLVQTTEFFETGYQMLAEYTENHVLAVLIAGIIVLVILILLILLLIFRCNSESRIKRRRKQEEKERKRREEEIDRMTTAEIEAELRAVMEQERLRKEQEQRALESAERAAEEARQKEEQAQETRHLLDELEEERQGRMADRK